ncbi:hypothetical protein BD410DRAFT_824680 [Rickenella mellea]|uniref:FHA domain-containing protein n=1 Tax=Rickenella mellea TaxID=50990 RepID=A0A4Y7QJN2_9AGAM|nr:hypothetical protein BD410DRAFT_824680 [Rickenella mellea]
MADATEVGRYGTIRLLKKSDAEVVVASFPVDEDVVTFGRDPSCSVRLYYAWVSGLHCKIVFDNRKAFLQVLGTNGLLVDGCQVFPVSPSAGAVTTVPLVNGSIIEIHKKRFQFTYPPKDLRPLLIATPQPRRRSSVRLSMITSSQVFSPRPSPDPRNNLRTLQSVFKPFAEDVKLVDGDHPIVMEEGVDLVILEDVPSAPSVPAPPPSTKTPRRRSAPSLHKAVLIRSAQRAAMQQEVQIEDANVEDMNAEEPEEQMEEEDDQIEEEEVEEAVSADLDDDEFGDEPPETPSRPPPQRPMSTSRLLPPNVSESESVRTDNSAPLEEMLSTLVLTPDHGQDQAKQADATPSKFGFTAYAKARQDGSTLKPLGPFMTPRAAPLRPPLGLGGRYSLGGRIVQPWKIKDIVESAEPSADGEMQVDAAESSDTRGRSPAKLSEEEKAAIRARRQSALATPDPVPGIHRTSALPPRSPPQEIANGNNQGSDEDKEDTRALLARMKETVSGMKMKRESLAGRKSLGAGSGLAHASPARQQPGQGFSLLASPVRGGGLQLQPPKEEDEEGMEVDSAVPEKLTIVPTAPASAAILGTPRAATTSRVPAPTLVPPKTPLFSGMRELFRVPAQPPQTPAYNGIRELYRRPPREPMTPTMEGLDELLATPEDMHGAMGQWDDAEEEGNRDDGKDDEARDLDEDVEIHEANEPAAPRAGPRTAARRVPARQMRGTPTDVSTMADDEATPAESYTRRGAKSSAKGVLEGVPEGAVVRRGRSKRVEHDEDEDGEVEAEETVEKPAKVPARRGRPPKARTPAPETDAEVEDASAKEKKTPKSRAAASRKARVKSEPPETDGADLSSPAPPVPALPKPRAGRTRTKTNTSDESAPPVPASRGRPAAARQDDQEDDDELDSIGRELQTVQETQPTKPPPKKAVTKRAARVKAAAGVAVESTVETGTGTGTDDVSAAPRRGPKARSTTRSNTTEPEDSASVANPTKTRKASAKSKTVSVAKDDDGLDKENAEEVVVQSAAKTSRARSASTKLAMVADEGVPAPAARVTRARARK